MYISFNFIDEIHDLFPTLPQLGAQTAHSTLYQRPSYQLGIKLQQSRKPLNQTIAPTFIFNYAYDHL